MCGRYFLTASKEEIRQQFGCVNSIEWQPRYNIAPTQTIPIVIFPGDPTSDSEDEERHLKLARWGLIPSWSKDEKIGQRLINARAETLTQRPAFGQALQRRRCLIPASGFYEWHRSERGNNLPYAILRQDGRLMALAGLWESWHRPNSSETMISCVIITTDANRRLQPLHRRMPVILEEEKWTHWLEPNFETPQTLLEPCREELLRFYPVSGHVNNPNHDDPRCLEPNNRTGSLFD